MPHIVKILSIEPVTHDVNAYTVEKPTGYTFNAGQATEVAINKPGWENEKRPFTFTSLNEDDDLQFTIKSYAEHKGVTNELTNLQPGDELIIDDVWGAIEYKGPGYFIAGGAGITPFIAILRQLAKDNNTEDNYLFFSNKTSNDIILRDELASILNDKALFIVTDEPSPTKYFRGFIDEAFIKTHVTDFSRHFYVCGPPPMIESINNILVKLGASTDAVVFEK
jgi:ferredoxin-NADP reductase